ncbi:hypothetical protein CS062_17355 [Roseateles chitinivorans]|uniref:Uncharacterized protein n=1 Tax=Roseateles chitinivorans TaxID=2917965 RepID=A0A2G9C6C3_9BURK|nr:hypothetical protein [Roseateles chitinivorans]PIM51892.1 hypothetical protein CS062_17355 [Roseateles chitinivorans]
MGYTTKFTGHLTLSRPLTMIEAKTLLEINEDPATATGNRPGDGYMQWVPGTDLQSIVWDGGEKFYDYTEWLQWVCGWLRDRGIVCWGTFIWSGEQAGDHGELVVLDNVVERKEGRQHTLGRFAPLTLRALADMALAEVTKP